MPDLVGLESFQGLGSRTVGQQRREEVQAENARPMVIRTWLTRTQSVISLSSNARAW